MDDLKFHYWMKVLSISSDRKIFEAGSAVRSRMVMYAGLFEELHIVVFNSGLFKREQIAPNAWMYPTNSWSRWFYIWDAVRIGSSIIRNWKLEIRNCVITSQDPFECGLVGRKLSERSGIRFQVQVHTDFLNPYFASAFFLNRIRVSIARRVLSQVSAVRVVSERIKNSLIQNPKFKIPESKIFVLPVYTDFEKYNLVEASFDLKQKYPDWSFIIVMVTRLSAEKNISFAFTLLKELLKKYPKTGLVIVGDGSMKDSLQSEVVRSRLTEHVAFEGNQKEVISYYKTAHLFLQTSLYEGFGLALLEAVMSGCPSVSTDTGIAPELLNHKGHSFVCAVNDTPCFVATISRLIEDNQLRTFFSLEIAPDASAPFILDREEYLKKYRFSLEAALR